jgi:hypothetical protein
MAELVDNLDSWADDTAHDRLDHHETLARLYELCNRYDGTSVTRLVSSASEAHVELTGHALAFGCCTSQDSILAALRREERRLLAKLEQEW